MRHILLILALWGWWACEPATPRRVYDNDEPMSYTIEGRVTDATDGRPIAEVSVTISGAPAGARDIAALTGTDGTFRFGDLPAPGRYTLKLIHPDGREKSHTLRLEDSLARVEIAF